MSLTKRLAVLSSCVGLLCLSASGYDTQGKFGMGIRIQGTPLITYSTLKFGVTNSLGIEPSLGYYQYQVKSTYWEQTYDPNTGLPDSVEVTDKLTSSLFLLSGIADLKPIRAERSNFVIRAGASYGLISVKEEYENSEFDDSANPVHLLSLQGGFGIEHFFTDHFSVNVGILSGIILFSNSDDDDLYKTQVSALHLGNQLADFALVWYLR